MGIHSGDGLGRMTVRAIGRVVMRGVVKGIVASAEVGGGHAMTSGLAVVWCWSLWC